MITLTGRGKPKFDRNTRVGYTKDARGNFARNSFGKGVRPGEYMQTGPGVFKTYRPKKSPLSNLKKGLLSGSKRTEIQSPQRPQARLYRPKKDDGIGEAMSPGQRANFLKGKNKGYKIRTTPTGATYGIRTTV